MKQTEQQVSCSLNGEVVILNLKSTLYFGLDKVGAFIWERLSEPQTVSDICKVVIDRYDVDQERCHVEVIEFLAKLHAAGLIDFICVN